MSEFVPSYVALLESGKLLERVEAAYRHMQSCDLCAWKCRANRRAGKIGSCKTAERPLVSSFFAHMGEEDCLRGWCGSGTIFFSNCNLRCQYCQNSDISQLAEGNEVTVEQLADMMLDLQAQGCHNINFVSPSHVVAPILSALLVAAQAGLHLPLVYNTGGYDSLAALALLDGVIDIYMPDMKYGDASIGQKYSKVPDYPRHNMSAVREMHRQVGDLVIDEDGIARRGLLVRHLVLPGGIAGTDRVLAFLADEISRHTYVNLMDQYRPSYRADEYPPVDRPLTDEQYRQALAAADRLGLTRLDGRAPARR